MGFLRTFEIELSEESKERKKIVGLRTEFELPVIKGMSFRNLWPCYQINLKEP